MAARVCYKSSCASEAESSNQFVRRITQQLHHESVIEHVSATVEFVCDRGVTHEIVRHRLAAYSQESTRYCNFSKDKFGGEISVIQPLGLWGEGISYDYWYRACQQAEESYLGMIGQKISPQIARSILPTCLASKIVMTANLREWRHVFKLRTAKAAHPQIRELMIPLLMEFQEHLPEIFDDIKIEE